MANLTIKNLPSEIYDQLKLNATQHRRSLNSEVIVCLERALRDTQIDAEAFLAKARGFRRKTSRFLLTDQILAKAKNEGRR